MNLRAKKISSARKGCQRNVAAVQVSFGRQQGHGNEHWFSHEQREDGYVRTAEAGLSAYYDKRWVLEDGIHTEPIEFHG